MIALVVQVPIAAGRPQLGLPAGVEVVREGDVYHVALPDGRALSLRLIGAPNGQDPILVGMASADLGDVLGHLGARLRTLEAAWSTPATRAFLVARGAAELDGRPVCPHVIAGASPVGPEPAPIVNGGDRS